MDFPPKRQKAEATPEPGEGKGFLTRAKGQHVELFQAYLEKADEYENLGVWVSALEKDAWKLTEEIAKQSWRNGIARGQARQKGA